MLPAGNWPSAGASGLGGGEAIQPALAGPAEVEGHLGHAREDDEEIGTELGRQQGAEAILVDDGLHPHQEAAGVADHRDAAPTARDHGMAGVQQGLDGIQLNDLQGRARAPPCATRARSPLSSSSAWTA